MKRRSCCKQALPLSAFVRAASRRNRIRIARAVAIRAQLSAFVRAASRRNGLANTSKPCKNALKRAWRRAKPEKAKAQTYR